MVEDGGRGNGKWGEVVGGGMGSGGRGFEGVVGGKRRLKGVGGSRME